MTLERKLTTSYSQREKRWKKNYVELTETYYAHLQCTFCKIYVNYTLGFSLSAEFEIPPLISSVIQEHCAIPFTNKTKACYTLKNITKREEIDFIMFCFVFFMRS